MVSLMCSKRQPGILERALIRIPWNLPTLAFPRPQAIYEMELVLHDCDEGWTVGSNPSPAHFWTVTLGKFAGYSEC